MRVPVPRRRAIALAAAALVALAGCTGHDGSGYVGPAPSAASPWKIARMVGPPGGSTEMQDIFGDRAAGCLGDRAGLLRLRTRFGTAGGRALGRSRLAAAPGHAPAGADGAERLCRGEFCQ